MTDIDRLAADTAAVLRTTLGRLSRLARNLLTATAVVSLATYVTGLWLTDSSGWRVGGAVMCAAPVGAALLAWWRLRRTAVAAPKAFEDLRELLQDQRLRSAMGVVIDHDTQRQIGPTTMNMAAMRTELMSRKDELPALYHTVRAVLTVPALVAIATAGLIATGILGTILLIVGLVT